MIDPSQEHSRFNLSRRSFVQGSALLGLTTAAGGLLTMPALAQEPKRGGNLRLGIGGGASADTLDPAMATATVAFVIAHCVGRYAGRNPIRRPVRPFRRSPNPGPLRRCHAVDVSRSARAVEFHDGSADDGCRCRRDDPSPYGRRLPSRVRSAC